MGEQKKESAPLHTGIDDGLFWGFVTGGACAVTSLAIVAVAVGGVPAAITFLTAGTLTAALSTSSTIATVAGMVLLEFSSIIGAAVFGGTIIDKRHEYEQAHNVIENASYDGRVTNINQSRGK